MKRNRLRLISAGLGTAIIGLAVGLPGLLPSARAEVELWRKNTVVKELEIKESLSTHERRNNQDEEFAVDSKWRITLFTDVTKPLEKPFESIEGSDLIATFHNLGTTETYASGGTRLPLAGESPTRVPLHYEVNTGRPELRVKALGGHSYFVAKVVYQISIHAEADGKIDLDPLFPKEKPGVFEFVKNVPQHITIQREIPLDRAD
ncbi:MAG: hypothetical protein QM755_03130 [Luteolibacter sp.]